VPGNSWDELSKKLGQHVVDSPATSLKLKFSSGPSGVVVHGSKLLG